MKLHLHKRSLGRDSCMKYVRNLYLSRLPDIVRVASLDQVHAPEVPTSEFHIAEALPSELFPKSLFST